MRRSKFLVLLLLNVLMFGMLGCLTYSHISFTNYINNKVLVEKDTLYIPIYTMESINTTFKKD